MADTCPRCSGRGWRWTGSAWAPCRSRLCGAPAGPAPVGAAASLVSMIPAADWQRHVADMTGARPGPARASTPADRGMATASRLGSGLQATGAHLSLGPRGTTIPLRAPEPTRTLGR